MTIDVIHGEFVGMFKGKVEKNGRKIVNGKEKVDTTEKWTLDIDRSGMTRIGQIVGALSLSALKKCK